VAADFSPHLNERLKDNTLLESKFAKFFAKATNHTFRAQLFFSGSRSHKVIMSSNNNKKDVPDFTTANYSDGLMKSIGAELSVMFGFIGLFILTYIVFHIVFKITFGDEDKALQSKLNVDSGKGKNIAKQPNRQEATKVEPGLPDGRPTQDTQTTEVVSQDENMKPIRRVTDDSQATQAANQDDVDKIESIPLAGKDRF
jgi:hypothetical protein